MESQAVSEEQYSWLEKDLQKAQKKHIYVVTHIPPEDPRSNTEKNEIPGYQSEAESGDGWAEQKLNSYNQNKKMEHGFQDPQEAARFETLMNAYHVEVVYLSHIHSYLEYKRDTVRYIISGGGGAELLTENSYYHFLVFETGNNQTMKMVQLPSPTNTYVSRYTAAVRLFASALYKENPAAVILVVSGFVLLIVLLMIKLYLRKKAGFTMIGEWLADSAKYSVRRFRQLYSEHHKNRVAK